MDSKLLDVKRVDEKRSSVVIEEGTGECFVVFDNFTVAVFKSLEAFKSFVVEKSKETGNDFETWKARRR